MTDSTTTAPGNLIKVEIRHAGAMILRETFFVSSPGDLCRVTDAAISAAAQRRHDVPASELLAHVVSDPVAPPSPGHGTK